MVTICSVITKAQLCDINYDIARRIETDCASLGKHFKFNDYKMPELKLPMRSVKLSDKISIYFDFIENIDGMLIKVIFKDGCAYRPATE